MKKYTFTTASAVLGLSTIFMATPAFATVEIAFSLYGDSYDTKCNVCHTRANLDTADNGNLMPAAKSAYRSGRLAGLRTFIAAAATPVTPTIPTCSGTQVLNAAKTACVTPAPVVPTCSGTQVLNAAKTACVASPAPIVTPPVTTPATPTTTTKNTKPVLNAVAKQWDATVGEPFKIPLSVNDAEQDDFTILFGTLAGAKLSAVKTDAANLPSIDFEWTPIASQANKIFTITFQAKETKTALKLVSDKVSVKVRVWAAGNRTSASVKTFAVTTSKFVNGKLNLSGKVTLNSILTITEKKDFLTQKLDLTVSDKTGILIGSVPLSLDASGNWSATLPVNSSTCDIILQYEGKNAARTVLGCTKPVAAITPPAILANNSLNNPFSGDDGNEDDNDDRNEHKDDKHKHD